MIKQRMPEESGLSQIRPDFLFTSPSCKESTAWLQPRAVASNPCDLRATIDPDAHLILDATVNSVVAPALIDSGATGVFIHPELVHKCNANLRLKQVPREVRVIDGRIIQSGLITHEASIRLVIGEHQETVTADVTNTGRFSVILGTPWLHRHDPTIYWPQRQVDFESSYCQDNCMASSRNDGAFKVGETGIPLVGGQDGADLGAAVPVASSSQEQVMVQNPTAARVKPSQRPVQIIKGQSSRPGARRPRPVKLAGFRGLQAPRHAFVSAAAFRLSAKDAEIYAIEISECAGSTSDSLPAEYQDLRGVFSEEASNELPNHGTSDMKIEFKEGQEPRNTGLRPMSPAELEELRKYLEENLGKGWIRRSKSPVSAPIVFARKKDGSIRVCIDYRNLNRVTIKNRYPLPLIPELTDRLVGATIFTKLDIRQAYHRVRMALGHEFKTAFKTRYGLFEYLVMPFGLTNAPAQFQSLMQNIFSDLLDISVVIYLDDILIFSKNLQDHQQVVRDVLQRLQKHGLYAKESKCQFHCQSVEFLGMIVSSKGLEMCQDKVQTIKEWPVPNSVKEIQSFLGFANFYRRFICDYSKIAVPLTTLTQKDKKFQWTLQADAAFKEIRSRFLQAPVLLHPNFEKPFVVETDASDVATGGILSQYGTDGYLHPCAYRSSKMSPTEQNYDIYDKELLSVVLAFQDWRIYLEGSPHMTLVISDHKNLEYFLTTKQLNRRQARWSEFLSAFNFEIQHRPGSLNGRADILSRRIDVTNGMHEEKRPLLRLAALESCEPVWTDDDIYERIKIAITEDTTLEPILSFCQNSSQLPLDMRRRLQGYTFKDGLLSFEGRIYVPNDNDLQRQILRSRHDAPAAGHQGRAKTLELVTRSFYWPTIRRYVHRYVDGCDICQRSKPTHHGRYGLMQPIPAGSAPWKRISTDFIVKLPKSNGYDSIMVVVDKNTKLAHFIPTYEKINAYDTASLYLNNIWKHHGTPQEVISDRGSVFVSKFMRRLCELLRIQPSPTTAFHPQSDGQTERVNQVVEQFLRMFTTKQQDDWVDLLPMAEFAYNNACHSATGFSPFYVTYGYHPSLSFLTPTTSTVPAAEDRVRHLQQIHDELKTMITIAGEQAKRNYDRGVILQPTFKIGDRVLLRHENIPTTTPCKKLDSKFLGPFKVISKLSDLVYKLQLPKTLRIHDTFHVSLLEKYREDTIPGRRQIPSPPIVTPDGDIEWEVRKVLDSRVFGRWKKLQYLVSWQGFGPEEDSWEPMANLENAPDAVAEFHRLHPKAPGPHEITTQRGH